MRTLFIMPLVLMSLVSFPSWGLTHDDLVKRDGLWYQKFSDVPFTGEVKGLEQGKFKEGKKEGSWESYWQNGQLWNKGNYKKGKKEGFWESYWQNGQLMHSGNFKNGYREGYWETYDTNGIIDDTWTGTYKNGEKVSE